MNGNLQKVLNLVAGGLIIGLMAWVGASAQQTSNDVSILLERSIQTGKRLDQHDDRFENISSRLRTTEQRISTHQSNNSLHAE